MLLFSTKIYAVYLVAPSNQIGVTIWKSTPNEASPSKVPPWVLRRALFVDCRHNLTVSVRCRLSRFVVLPGGFMALQGQPLIIVNYATFNNIRAWLKVWELTIAS
jgi:hypothetical protein